MATKINFPETNVRDNGRRGAPKPGCDCEQCFGYCISDPDKYQRELALMREDARRARVDAGLPIHFK